MDGDKSGNNYFYNCDTNKEYILKIKAHPGDVTQADLIIEEYTATPATPWDFSGNTWPSSVTFRGTHVLGQSDWSDAGLPFVFSDGTWTLNVTPTNSDVEFALKLNDGTYFGKSGGTATADTWIDGMMAGNNINCHFTGLIPYAPYRIEVTSDGENKAKARLVAVDKTIGAAADIYLRGVDSNWSAQTKWQMHKLMDATGATWQENYYVLVAPQNMAADAFFKIGPSVNENWPWNIGCESPGNLNATSWTTLKKGAADAELIHPGVALTAETGRIYLYYDGTIAKAIVSPTGAQPALTASASFTNVYLYKAGVDTPIADLKTSSWSSVFSVPCADEYYIQAVYTDSGNNTTTSYLAPASSVIGSPVAGAALTTVASADDAAFTFGEGVGEVTVSFSGSVEAPKVSFATEGRKFYLYIVTGGSTCAKVAEFKGCKVEFNANNDAYYFVSTLDSGTDLSSHYTHRFGPSEAVTYQQAETADEGNVALPIGASHTKAVSYNDAYSWRFLNDDKSKHSITLTVNDGQPVSAVVKNLPNYTWVIYAVSGTAPTIWTWSDGKTGGETYNGNKGWNDQPAMERYGDDTNLWMFAYSGDDTNPINRIQFNKNTYEVKPDANPLEGATSYDGFVFDLTQGNNAGNTDYHSLDDFMTPKIWGSLDGDWSRAKHQMEETSAGSGIWKYEYTVASNRSVIWNLAYNGYDYQNTTSGDKQRPTAARVDNGESYTYTTSQLGMSVTGYASGHSWELDTKWVRKGSTVTIYFDTNSMLTYAVIETPKAGLDNANYYLVSQLNQNATDKTFAFVGEKDGRYVYEGHFTDMPTGAYYGTADVDKARQYYIKSNVNSTPKAWVNSGTTDWKYTTSPGTYYDTKERTNAGWGFVLKASDKQIDGHDVSSRIYFYLIVDADNGDVKQMMWSTNKMTVTDVLPDNVGYRSLEVTPRIVFNADSNWDAWTDQPVVYVLGDYLNDNRCVPDWEMENVVKDNYTKFQLKDVTLRGAQPWSFAPDGKKPTGEITILILDGKASTGTTITLEPDYSDNAVSTEGTPSARGKIAGLSARKRHQLGRSFDITVEKRDGVWYAKAERTAERGVPFIGMVGYNFQQKDNEDTYNAKYGQGVHNTRDGWQESWILYDASGRPMRDLYGTYIYSTQWPPKNTIFFNGVKGSDNLELSSDNLIFSPVLGTDGKPVIKTGAEWASSLQGSTSNKNGEYDNLDFNPDNGAWDPDNGKWGNHDNQLYIRYVINNSWLLGATKIWSGWGAQTNTNDKVAEWSNNMNWGYKGNKDNDGGTKINARETGWMIQDAGNFMFNQPAYFKSIEFYLPVANTDGDVDLTHETYWDNGTEKMYDNNLLSISRAHFYAIQSVGNATIRARAINNATHSTEEPNSGQMLARIDTKKFPAGTVVLEWNIRRYDAVGSKDGKLEPMGTADNPDPENNLVAQWFRDGFAPEGQSNVNTANIHLYELSGDDAYNAQGFEIGVDEDATLENGRYFYALYVKLGYPSGNNDATWEETVQSNPFTIANYKNFDSTVQAYQLIKIHAGYDDKGETLALPSEFSDYDGAYISNQKVGNQYLLVYPADYGGSSATASDIALRQTARVLEKAEADDLIPFLRGTDGKSYEINDVTYENNRAFGPRFYTWTSDYYVVAFRGSLYKATMEAALNNGTLDTYQTYPDVYVGIVADDTQTAAKTSANKAVRSIYQGNGIYGRIVKTDGDLQVKKLHSNISYTYLPAGDTKEKKGAGEARGKATPVVPRPFGVTCENFANTYGSQGAQFTIPDDEMPKLKDRTFTIPSQLVNGRNVTFVVEEENFGYRDFAVEYKIHQPNVSDQILNKYRIRYDARFTNDFTLKHYATKDAVTGEYTFNKKHDNALNKDYYESDQNAPGSSQKLRSYDDPYFMLVEGAFYDIDQTQLGAYGKRLPYSFKLNHCTPLKDINPVFQVVKTTYERLADENQSGETALDPKDRYLVADYAYDELNMQTNGGFELGESPYIAEEPGKTDEQKENGFWFVPHLNGQNDWDWQYIGHHGFVDPGDVMNTDGENNHNKEGIFANFYILEMANFETNKARRVEDGNTVLGSADDLRKSYYNVNGKTVKKENYAVWSRADEYYFNVDNGQLTGTYIGTDFDHRDALVADGVITADAPLGTAIRHNCGDYACNEGEIGAIKDGTFKYDHLYGQYVARHFISPNKKNPADKYYTQAEASDIQVAYTPVYIYKHQHVEQGQRPDITLSEGLKYASDMANKPASGAPRRAESSEPGYGGDPSNPSSYGYIALVGSPFVKGGTGKVDSQLTIIEEIEAPQPIDNEAQYYNLMGIRVYNPEPGNVYIVRRGDKVTKEIILE